MCPCGAEFWKPVVLHIEKERLDMRNSSFNTRGDEPRRERPRNAKETRLLDILKYWGFHAAAINMDTRHVDLDAAIASLG